jgi:hypothetical protein
LLSGLLCKWRIQVGASRVVPSAALRGTMQATVPLETVYSTCPDQLAAQGRYYYNLIVLVGTPLLLHQVLVTMSDGHAQ